LHERVSGSPSALHGELVELLFRLRLEVYFHAFKIRESLSGRK
jgi:hypothetical protein